MKNSTNLKNILITGASSGLGRALALGFAASNVTLILSGRNQERLGQVAKACRDKKAIVITKVIDVCDQAAMEQWLSDCDKQTPLDLVIANAGVSNAGATLSMADNQRLIDINLQSVLNTIHPMIPRMQARQSGQIAVMSSLAGFRGLARSPAYSAAKAAVRVYGEALSVALLKDNVHLSVICPGFVATPLTDKNDFKMPFIMPAEKAATIMIKKLIRKKPLIIYPKRMHFLVWLLSSMPSCVARKITAML